MVPLDAFEHVLRSLVVLRAIGKRGEAAPECHPPAGPRWSGDGDQLLSAREDDRLSTEHELVGSRHRAARAHDDDATSAR